MIRTFSSSSPSVEPNCRDNWVIKVVCKGNNGVPDLSLALTGLDVWMPLWMRHDSCKTCLNLQGVPERRDRWFPLQKAPGRELHLGLCYRKFEPNDGPVASNTFVDEAVTDVTTRGLEDEEESPYKGKVMVTVQKAENLIKLDTAWSDDKGLDPYVVIDFGKQTKKTKVKDTLNPNLERDF